MKTWWLIVLFVIFVTEFVCVRFYLWVCCYMPLLEFWSIGHGHEFEESDEWIMCLIVWFMIIIYGKLTCLIWYNYCVSNSECMAFYGIEIGCSECFQWWKITEFCILQRFCILLQAVSVVTIHPSRPNWFGSNTILIVTCVLGLGFRRSLKRWKVNA